MYMSYELGRNAWMTNSQNWLELVLKYHLHLKQRKIYGGGKLWEGNKLTRKIQ